MTTQTNQYAALYLTDYAADHKRGCPLSLPEIRAAIFRPACECGPRVVICADCAREIDPAKDHECREMRRRNSRRLNHG